ncbi:MAG: DUF2793 domain-containing protein [Rickettsiales bacterium]|jgi:hypothetical protein|nr:DUF2793 domain-containing protein [Rickettsiales bacterium]
MEYTNNLKLPLLVPSQSGKEFTHNEALIMLDNILHSGIIDIINEPPLVLAIGDKYLVDTNPVGDFINKENQIAIYDNGWRFIVPAVGQIVWNMTKHRLMVFGENWEEVTVKNADARFDENFNIVSPQEDDILSYSNGKFTNNGNLLQILLNLKANSNFSNIEISARKIVSNLSAPSNRYIGVSVGPSGSYYTAPANGYVSMLSMATADNAVGALKNTTASNLIHQWVIPKANCYVGVFIPCAENNILQYEYHNQNVTQLFFHYANGN